MKRELFCQVLRIYLCNLQVAIINCGIQGEYRYQLLAFIKHILYEDKKGVHLYFIAQSLVLLARYNELFYLSLKEKETESILFNKTELALSLSVQAFHVERQEKNEKLSKHLTDTVTELDALQSFMGKHYDQQLSKIILYKTLFKALPFDFTLYRNTRKLQKLYTDILNMYLHLYAVEFVMENVQKESYEIKSKKIGKKIQSTLRLFWQLLNTIKKETRLYYSNKFKTNRRLSNRAYQYSGFNILWKTSVELLKPWKYIVHASYCSRGILLVIHIAIKQFQALKQEFSDLKRKTNNFCMYRLNLSYILKSNSNHTVIKQPYYNPIY